MEGRQRKLGEERSLTRARLSRRWTINCCAFMVNPPEMEVFQVRIKGYASINAGIPWLHYGNEREIYIVGGDGGARGLGRETKIAPARLLHLASAASARYRTLRS